MSQMIKKVLIANRGEIAVRIIRACREMGIETVAVYSEADREALHTQLADEAICIGPAPSTESYLSMDRIISATIISGADAIHPGFGFLSENSRFAELCEQCNITFIGPGSDVIARLGNKQEARNTMVAAGVPVIPGSKEPVYDAKEGAKIAEEIGYPVIVKAALGGGGKGMRVAQTPEERSGWAMSILVTGQVSGALVGPLLGGWISQLAGIRENFFIMGACALAGFLILFFFVREDFTRPEKRERQSWKERYAFPVSRPLILLFLTTFAVQFALMSIAPVITVYVKHLVPESEHVALLAGGMPPSAAAKQAAAGTPFSKGEIYKELIAKG